jgi:hypothetical protein
MQHKLKIQLGHSVILLIRISLNTYSEFKNFSMLQKAGTVSVFAQSSKLLIVKMLKSMQLLIFTPWREKWRTNLIRPSNLMNSQRHRAAAAALIHIKEVIVFTISPVGRRTARYLISRPQHKTAEQLLISICRFFGMVAAAAANTTRQQELSAAWWQLINYDSTTARIGFSFAVAPAKYSRSLDAKQGDKTLFIAPLKFIHWTISTHMASQWALVLNTEPSACMCELSWLFIVLHPASLLLTAHFKGANAITVVTEYVFGI